MGHLMEDEIGEGGLIPLEHGRKDRVFQPSERAIGPGFLDKRVVTFRFEESFLLLNSLLCKKTLIGYLAGDGKIPMIKSETILLRGRNDVENWALDFEIF